MTAARVLVLYNEPVLAKDHPDYLSEQEVVDTAEAIATQLSKAGFDVVRLGASRDPAAIIAGVRQTRPDVVFNLFEGTADQGNTESVAAGLLEWLGVSFTGSTAQPLCLARNKHLAKHLFRSAGLPTPAFLTVNELPVPASDLAWPVIVKPALQDASIGVDQGSVVTDQRQLEQRVALLLERYGPPVLVEEYIDGRELGVGLIEAPRLTTLPAWEIAFLDKRPGYWPIVTYDAKWKPGSPDYELTPPRYPAEVTPKLARRLATLARKAYELIGCRDYGRVDFRVKPTGRAYLLEVNPNPCLSPDAGLAGGLSAVGLTHAQLLVQMVHNALNRRNAAGSLISCRPTSGG